MTKARLSVPAKSIRVSGEVRQSLRRMKVHRRETFNDVLERLLEVVSEVDKATLVGIRAARAEVRTGKYLTQDQVRKALGL